MSLLMYLETIKKTYFKQMCLPIVPEGKSFWYLFNGRSDLKFKNTALMLTASIFIKKSLIQFVGAILVAII